MTVREIDRRCCGNCEHAYDVFGIRHVNVEDYWHQVNWMLLRPMWATRNNTPCDYCNQIGIVKPNQAVWETTPAADEHLKTIRTGEALFLCSKCYDALVERDDEPEVYIFEYPELLALRELQETLNETYEN